LPASEIVDAHWTTDRRGHERFRCEQQPYSILTRAIEHDVLPACQRYGMGVIPYSPLAGGWLSGRYRKDHEATGPSSSARPSARFDLTDPANQLSAADVLSHTASPPPTFTHPGRVPPGTPTSSARRSS
jgi:aryl-alcohol dehydrogenase-like predicted oxidoreductase